MTGLRGAVEDYLALRRSLGFKLERSGQLLADFAGYLDASGAATVTIELALAWATMPADADPAWWRMRLAAIRPFARYLAAFIPGTEVPPAGLMPGPVSRRAVPYLYSRAEITALMSAAGSIRSPLRAATYQTLIGLLAVTGMRAGEAIRLDRADASLPAGLVTIRQSKFGKSRQLPLHPTTTAALAGYAALRDLPAPARPTPAFFVSADRNPADLQATCTTLPPAHPGRRADPAVDPGCRPRTHDLRHSFAVATLLSWYQDGGDVAARLPLLSAWLGHADPGSTYWYLTGTHLTCSPWPPPGWKPPPESRDDSPGPDPSGVLHRPAGPAAPGQPAHHRRLPRHLAAPHRLRRRTGSQAALPARRRRPGRTNGRRVPRLPRAAAGQQPPHPQRPARSDPLALRLRSTAAPRARRRRSPGCWPSQPNATTRRWSPGSPNPS